MELSDVSLDSHSVESWPGLPSAKIDFFLDHQQTGWHLFITYWHDRQSHPENLLEVFSDHYRGLPLLSVGGAVKTSGQSFPLPFLALTQEGVTHPIVLESGVSYQLKLEEVLNSGLFLDQKENRKLLRQWMSNSVDPNHFRASGEILRLLNLFSYTGSFSVSFLKEAQDRSWDFVESISVDTSRNYLGWEKTNHELNRTETSSRRVREDSRRYVKSLVKKIKNTNFKGIHAVILDPPTFSRGEEGVFQVQKDLPILVSEIQTILVRPSFVLVAMNDLRWEMEDFQNQIQDRMDSKFLLKEAISQGDMKSLLFTCP